MVVYRQYLKIRILNACREQQNQNRGYSLFESMIVIAISALLIALTGSSWQNYQQRQRLDDASLQVITFLNRIQMAANWRNKVYVLQLYQQQQQQQQNWYLHAVSDGQPTGLVFIQPDLQIQIADYNANYPITFYGQRNMALAGHLTLENAAGRVRVIVSPRGRVRRCREGEVGPSGVVRC